MRLSVKSPTASVTPSTVIYLGLLERVKLTFTAQSAVPVQHKPCTSSHLPLCVGTPVRVAKQPTEQYFALRLSGLPCMPSQFSTRECGQVCVVLLGSPCCSLSCSCCQLALSGPWKTPSSGKNISLKCFYKLYFL